MVSMTTSLARESPRRRKVEDPEWKKTFMVDWGREERVFMTTPVEVEG